jgi:hypothetical protein
MRRASVIKDSRITSQSTREIEGRREQLARRTRKTNPITARPEGTLLWGGNVEHYICALVEAISRCLDSCPLFAPAHGLWCGPAGALKR